MFLKQIDKNISHSWGSMHIIMNQFYKNLGNLMKHRFTKIHPITLFFLLNVFTTYNYYI
jgi:hypothetical protein